MSMFHFKSSAPSHAFYCFVQIDVKGDEEGKKKIRVGKV